MVVAALFAQVTEVFGVEDYVVEDVLLDVSITFVAQHLLADRGTRVAEVHVQSVLVAVQGDNGQFVGVLSEADARDVAVGIQGHLHLSGHFRLDVKGVHGYFGVGFAGFRIFVDVLAGIFL